MSNEKVLTKEIAEQFLADPWSVNLSDRTAIEDSAAEILSKCKVGLNLSGLTSLSDSAAERLSECGNYLWLDGIGCLSDSAAEILSKHEGELSLGVTSLSDVQAESLGNSRTDPASTET